MNETRHPAGRSCLGVFVLIVGGFVAGVLAIGHAVVTQDPTVPANAPAAVVQQLAPTTGPEPTTSVTVAPASPRAMVAEPTTTTESAVTEPTTDNPPEYVDLGSGVTQRVAPPNPTGTPPATDPDSLAKAGMDPNGNPVGPPSATAPPTN